MKAISILLLVLYELVPVSLAANDKTTKNYDIAAEAAGKGLELGEQLKFYEIWQAYGTVQETIAGFSHYRVVVGVVTKKKNKDKSYTWDFKGTAYDMQTATAGWGTNGSPIVGQKIEIVPEEWRANEYWNDEERVWVPVSKPNSYEGGATATKDKAELTALCEGYQETYGTYLILVNDCREFAKWLMDRA